MTLPATALFVGALLPFLDLLRHHRTFLKLSAATDPRSDVPRPLPRLSAIVPARNEVRGIGAAVDSILRQDYPDLEVVLVNDRSTDGTGRIIARAAAEHPERVRAVTVRDLPAGWLGKNHALWLGAQRVTGEWFLFTDADVVFHRTCFRRAVAYAEAEGLDHLTLSPRVTGRSYRLNAFVAFFVYAFLSYQRPHLANDPKSQVGVGIGAFNLIRRSAYTAIGTHAAISLRPDDDVRLACA